LVVPVLPAMSERFSFFARVAVPTLDDVLHHRVHVVGDARVEHLLRHADRDARSPSAMTSASPFVRLDPATAAGARCIRLEQQIALGIFDALDQVGLDPIAAVGEHA
jgi:hypothetical protein